MMDGRGLRLGYFLLLCLVPFLHHAVAIRFVMDRGECFSHNVDYEGDTVHVSFVVIKADTPWHYSEDGVDLVVWSSSPYVHYSINFSMVKYVLVVGRE